MSSAPSPLPSGPSGRPVPSVPPVPSVEGHLTAAQVEATVDSIAAVQMPSGLIPWFPGGHADPWNHVEAAMALTVGGRRADAEAAYRWLAGTQHDDGGWYLYYRPDGTVLDTRRDSNVSCYIAVGVWHHYLHTGDREFLERLWPVAARGIDFALGLQQPGGEVLWSYEPEPDGSPCGFALLTGTSSIHTSLRCGLAAAGCLGHERPEWELAAARLGQAVAHHPEAFQPKERWAMDWYYPVLAGVLTGDAGRARLAEGWGRFVMDGLGVRCVSDRPWVTAAETCEAVLALDAVGLSDEAHLLFGWAQHLRHEAGAYWTGCVHPERVHFPAGELSTWTSAAVVLAANALGGRGPAAGLFRGESLPSRLEMPALDEVAEA